MADLFSERVNSFTQFLGKLQQLGQPVPGSLQDYEARLRIAQEVQMDGLLNAENILAKFRIESQLAEQKYNLASKFEERDYEKLLLRQKQAQAQSLIDTEELAAAGLRQLEGFETERGLLDRKVAPGQKLRPILRIKKFDKTYFFNNINTRFNLINQEASNLSKTQEAKLPGSGSRKQALQEEVLEMYRDLTNPIVMDKMQDASAADKAMYDAYLKNIQNIKNQFNF